MFSGEMGINSVDGRNLAAASGHSQAREGTSLPHFESDTGLWKQQARRHEVFECCSPLPIYRVEHGLHTQFWLQESGMADVIVDARGLSCPLPVLKARRVLREMPSGGTAEILSTDPNSLEDFPSFCRAAGHELLEATQVEDAFRFVIKKGEG